MLPIPLCKQCSLACALFVLSISSRTCHIRPLYSLLTALPPHSQSIISNPRTNQRPNSPNNIPAPPTPDHLRSLLLLLPILGEIIIPQIQIHLRRQPTGRQIPPITKLLRTHTIPRIQRIEADFLAPSQFSVHGLDHEHSEGQDTEGCEASSDEAAWPTACEDCFEEVERRGGVGRGEPVQVCVCEVAEGGGDGEGAGCF